MTTSNLPRYRINGVIDTGKPVMNNLENIANSAGAWITYDITDGKWAVVINKAETSAHSFDDSNIVGAIKLSGSGLDELYNSVEVQFPMRDIQDQNDYVRIEIPAVDRKPNEPDHTLTLTYPLVNQPVQATLLGFQELKQSRMDYIIEFSTDYSKNDVLAGDVIDVTAPTYGFTNKLFRVLQIQEIDSTNGLEYKITALEYADSVYDTGTLEYYLRSNADGVITIGDIGKMATPTITKTEVDRKPSVLVESTIPDNTDPTNQAGIIEGVEVWYYPIPASELPTWETVDDDARVYTLHSTVRPFGEVYAPGDDFSHSISDFDAANLLIKLRAVNAVTQGPYSTRSGLIAYVPKQTTDNITDTTEVDEGSGNILTSLGAAGLIGFLNSLMRDGSAGSGSLFEKIFSVFNTEEGFALNDPSLKQVATTTGSPQISVATGSHDTGTVLPPVLIANGTMHTVTFTPTYTGNYVIQCLFDTKGSIAAASPTDLYGYRGTVLDIVNSSTGNTVPDPTPGAPAGSVLRYIEPQDNLGVRFELYDNLSNLVSVQGSGGPGGNFWQDFILSDTVGLTSGTTYTLIFKYGWATTYANSNTFLGFDLSYNVFSTL